VTGKFEPEFVASVVEHMNSDHADAVSNYAEAFGEWPAGIENSESEPVKLTDVTANGIELSLGGQKRDLQKITIPYTVAGLPQELEGPEQVRTALVLMAKAARKALE